MVTGLRDGGRLTGQHRPGRGLGIHRIRLAPPAAGRAIRPVHLPHHLTLAGQKPGQAGPIAAGAFHPECLDLAQALGPGQQRPIAPGRGRHPGRGQTAAQLVQGAGDMKVAVGVDADGDPGRLELCDGGDGRLPSGQGPMAAPAGRADSTATSLWRQAPVRSRSLGWCSPGR
jgi:hypothetical protein